MHMHNLSCLKLSTHQKFNQRENICWDVLWFLPVKNQRSWYDFLINGRFSVGSSDRHNIGSHRCNLIYLVCSCTHGQGLSIWKPQFSWNFLLREGLRNVLLWLLAEARVVFFENLSRAVEFSCQPVSQLNTTYQRKCWVLSNNILSYTEFRN